MNTTGEILYALPDLDNVTDYSIPVQGWVSSSRDRGSMDIIWSCCLTIFLCCWVATHPNASAPDDKWYHAIIDRFHLAMIGFLGPDFLLGIALGQLSSARRSVKQFNQDKSLSYRRVWSLQDAFFVDMGGIHLSSPDFPQGFPINAQQLHYLVKHNHVDFPNMEEMMIGERNTTDTLSRIITVWQVTWFSITEFQRLADGLPMTTLELTALSFCAMMMATTLCWYHKPSITRPRMISTRHEKLIKEIREEARLWTHPDLSRDPDSWYRTPLDFIGRYRWGIGTHWAYYTGLTHKFHFPVVSRSIKTRLWDRFPSDMWLPPDASLLPLVAPVMLAFSVSFLFAWDFYFPTKPEQTIWRTSSAYHAFFSIYGGVYYLIEAIKWNLGKEEKIKPPPNRTNFTSLDDDTIPLSRATRLGQFQSDVEAQSPRFQKWPIRFLDFRFHDFIQYARSFRNVSPDQDPQMALSLRLIIPVTITCILYIYCRLFLYIEDFIAFRIQPVGVYITVNKFLPFMGD